MKVAMFALSWGLYHESVMGYAACLLSLGSEAMTIVEFYACFAAWLVLAATIIAAAWLCFRQTRVRGFLFLAVILVLWPWFEDGTEVLRKHFTDQVFKGQKPWLFPFSLMVKGDAGGKGWQMSPGEFLTKFSMAKELLLFALLAIAFVLIARSLKRKLPRRQDP
jgi:hypothetical protein